MSTPLKFKFPIATLIQEGDYVLNAAEAHAADLAARLPADYVTQMRGKYTTLGGKVSGQKTAKSNVGDLTKEQNDALDVLRELMGGARESAKLAFPGQDVKLKNEFQIGNHTDQSLGGILQRANIIHDSCALTANAPALAAKGWIADDTTELADAIAALDTKDDTQETAKGTGTGATGDRNGVANDLYDGLLAIQNAANNKWKASKPANATIRGEFRLGIFPPNPPVKKKTPAPAPPPPANP